MTNAPPSTPRSLTRRKMLVGSAAVGAAWAAPSVLRIDRAAAAAGSCVPVSVNWSTLTGPSGDDWTATGTTGTITATATIRRILSGGATPSVFISGGQIGIGMSNHQIGDRWRVRFSFTDSAGGDVCLASVTVIDIDRNGRYIGCPTNSRFEDNIDNLVGPGMSTSTFGNLAEAPLGNFVSTLNCKTANTENLAINWSAAGNITGAGFRWRAGTPPGPDPRLDYQVILVSPMSLCVDAPPAAAGNRAVAYAERKTHAISLVGGTEHD